MGQQQSAKDWRQSARWKVFFMRDSDDTQKLPEVKEHPIVREMSLFRWEVSELSDFTGRDL